MYYTNFYTQSGDFVFDAVLIVSYWGPDYNRINRMVIIQHTT